MSVKIPTIEHFEELASKVYEQARDESRRQAQLTIAAALLRAFLAGGNAVFDDTEQKLMLAQSKTDKIQ